MSRATISATPTQVVYDEWQRIPPGLRTSGQWQGDGRGIKKGVKKGNAKALLDLDGNGDPNRIIGLYDKSQTYEFTEPKRSKCILIKQFVPRNELFGLRPVGEDQPIQKPTRFLHCSVGELVYSSFNYKHRGKGIPTSFYWDDEETLADAFYVLAGSHTDWFVLDLDNHFPTKASTKAHLLLVEYLVKKMPEVVKSLGGGSVFYDYAQESPRGIHIWVTLNRKGPVKSLHETVRRILKRHADPALDSLLTKNGLKPMGSLEILPTEGQLIRMFGTYDRRVFTTRELKPKNEGFDAESLLAHIRGKTTNGDPSMRYAQLARAGLGNDLGEAPSAVSVPPVVLALSSTHPTQRSGYFSRIVEACLNGVTDADVLYEAYLSPIAQALYWREFHDQQDRMRLTQDALVRWIDNKHNGLVTRIKDGKRKVVVNQIRHVVKRLPSTPSAIRSFWGKVLANDLAYPHQKVSLTACIDAVVAKPVQVTKGNLKRLPALLGGTGGNLTKGNTYNVRCIPPSPPLSLPSSLPPLLETRLRDHLQRAGVRTGKCTERIVLFALSLLNEIGVKGTRTIDGKRMNQLAGLGNGRKHILHYKRLFVGAGILETGWKNTASKAKKLASRYHLTPWAVAELASHWTPAPSH